ncbi:hypothetical protein V8F33_012985 [Rhypophila sp. PSN 637]
MSLASMIGDKQFMPSVPDTPSVVINCHSGYSQTNRSWLLGRILRDYELRIKENPGPEVASLLVEEGVRSLGLGNHMPLRISLRIDTFDLDATRYLERPKIDSVWILGGLAILAQLIIALIPWVLYGDWTIFFITASGTVFALATGSLRQWSREKWPGRRLNSPVTARSEAHPVAGKDIENGDCGASPLSAKKGQPHKCECTFKPKKKTVVLTQGNGHSYIMVIRGSGPTWDLETLATATSDSLPETRWCLAVLTMLWICLLISVSGLQENTWFLVAVGALGMVQNVHASSAARSPESLGLALRPCEKRPTIIGSSTCERMFWPKNEPVTQDSDGLSGLMEEIKGRPEIVVGVRGAIRELEKTIPRAGFALMPVFFPATPLHFEPELYRDEREAAFWRMSLERIQGGKVARALPCRIAPLDLGRTRRQVPRDKEGMLEVTTPVRIALSPVTSAQLTQLWGKARV